MHDLVVAVAFTTTRVDRIGDHYTYMVLGYDLFGYVCVVNFWLACWSQYLLYQLYLAAISAQFLVGKTADHMNWAAPHCNWMRNNARNLPFHCSPARSLARSIIPRSLDCCLTFVRVLFRSFISSLARRFSFVDFYHWTVGRTEGGPRRWMGREGAVNVGDSGRRREEGGGGG